MQPRAYVLMIAVALPPPPVSDRPIIRVQHIVKSFGTEA